MARKNKKNEQDSIVEYKKFTDDQIYNEYSQFLYKSINDEFHLLNNISKNPIDHNKIFTYSCLKNIFYNFSSLIGLPSYFNQIFIDLDINHQNSNISNLFKNKTQAEKMQIINNQIIKENNFIISEELFKFIDMTISNGYIDQVFVNYIEK